MIGFCVGPFVLPSGQIAAAQTGRIIFFSAREFGGSGDVTMNLEWVGLSTTTFNLRITTGNPASGGIRTTIKTGTIIYSTNEKISFRIGLDGKYLVLWGKQNGDVSASGSEDFRHPYTKHIAFRRLHALAKEDLGSGEYIFFDVIDLIECDTPADRPDSDITLQTFFPTSDFTSAQDWGDRDDCTTSSVDGTYTDVLLDGSNNTVTDGSAHLCRQGGNGGHQGRQ